MDEMPGRLRFWRDHRWAPGRMSAYLDGELAPPVRGRMEAHLAECAECRRLIASLKRLIGALHHLPGPPTAPDPARMAVAVRGRLSGPAPPG